jgi:hypothetical protein
MRTGPRRCSRGSKSLVNIVESIIQVERSWWKVKYPRYTIMQARYPSLLVRISVTQRPGLNVEQRTRHHRDTLNIERHLMICVCVDVIAGVAHIVRIQRYAREGGEVGWMVMLPLYTQVSKAVSWY